MCCTRLAENTGGKKSPFWHHGTTLSGYIFGTKACIDNRKKNLLNSNTSSTCPDNMVNFGLLTAEICWRVWGPLQISTGFAFLAALLHGAVVVGVSQTAAFNRGRHLYSAGRLSRWLLAHILVLFWLLVNTNRHLVTNHTPVYSDRSQLAVDALHSDEQLLTLKYRQKTADI